MKEDITFFISITTFFLLLVFLISRTILSFNYDDKLDIICYVDHHKRLKEIPKKDWSTSDNICYNQMSYEKRMYIEKLQGSIK